MATPSAVLTASSVVLVLGPSLAVAVPARTSSPPVKWSGRSRRLGFHSPASRIEPPPIHTWPTSRNQSSCRRAQPFAKHVSAFLIAVSPVTFRSEIAYVFDSSSSAAAAARAEPLAQWMTSTDHPVTSPPRE